MSMLYVLAVVIAMIGLFLFIVGYLSDADLGTRTWGMLCFITSAGLCLLKYYLANPAQVNEFLKSLVGK